MWFFIIAFALWFAALFAWFALCYRLFRMLETQHPQKYAEMGRPGLIANNSIASNIAFMKFLFGREYVGLDDPAVAKLGRFMRAFVGFYLAAFAALFLALLAGYTP